MNRLGDPFRNVTVTASAGTGKTWQLVSRLVRLLFAGARPDSILAITFTRKAAAEMQSRLAERLLQLASLQGAELDLALLQMSLVANDEHRQRAGQLYEEWLHAARPLRTTTFHAFCQEILRRFPLEADVPPGFELLEASCSIVATALQALINEAEQEPRSRLADDLLYLLKSSGSHNNLRSALHGFLQHRSDWWAMTAGAADPAAHAATLLQQQLQVDMDADPLPTLFTEANLARLVIFRDRLLQHDIKTNREQAEHLAGILNQTSDTDTRHALLRMVFLTQKGTPRSRKPSKAQAEKMTLEGEEEFLQIHHDICHQLVDVHGILAAQNTFRLHQAWYRLGERLLEHYQRIKAEQRLLDFTDLEWRAYQLLSQSDNAHWVQYKLDQRIDHLLVDEFQDTNPTQWRLLLPLLEEMAAGNSERQRSVFLVGDGKQSIYRFRRAEPRLFEAAREWLETHMQAHAHPLHTSYRSAPAIMEAVNAVFDAEGPLAGQLPDFATHSTHHGELWGHVEVLPLIEKTGAGTAAEEQEKTELRNPLHQPRAENPDDRPLREGRQIATTIRELMAANTLLGTEGRARPLQYGDILILLRKRTHAQAYEQALREAGIPYLGANRGTLLASQEIEDLHCLLHVLTTPQHNLALAQVLRSPVFACSDEDLLQLARHTSWHEQLLQLTPATGSPLARAQTLLIRWQELTRHLPIHDLLDRIYSEGNLIARYEAAYPAHLRSRLRGNLTRFLELALDIDQGRYPSLGRFLDRLTELRASDESPDEGHDAGAGECVRLLTIHGAKGLEAGVVFLADTASAGTGNRAWEVQVGWPAEAAQPDHFLLLGKKTEQDAFTRKQLEDEAAANAREEANLLYVAMTRARQMLYVTGSESGNSKAGSWYGLLREALPEPLQSNHPPRQAATKPLVTNTAEPVPPPAALQKIIQTASNSHEIAPSRQMAGHAPGVRDEDALLRGMVIHRLLELLGRDMDLSTARTRLAREYALDEGDANLAAWCIEAETVWNGLQGLLESSARHWQEIPVIYELDGLTVHGILDLLLDKAGELIIIDYKTHQAAKNGDLPTLATPYRKQLAAYVEGVQRLWPGKTVRSYLLFTASNTLYEI